MSLNSQFVRYFIVAILAYVVDLGGFWFLFSSGMKPTIANLVVKVVAALFGFFMHRKFTYAIKKNTGVFLHAIKYFGLAFVYTPLSTICLFYLMNYITSPVYAKITADIILFIATYTITTLLVFTQPNSIENNKSNTPP